MTKRVGVLMGLVLLVCALAGTASAKGGAKYPAKFCVGAAKEDVTPTDLTNFYNGGYGIGPTHPASKASPR